MPANLAAFPGRPQLGETAQLLQVHYEVEPARRARHLPGGERDGGRGVGLIAASVRSGLPLFLAATRSAASVLLHQLSRHERFGVRTVQAEDEIAASIMALGGPSVASRGHRQRRPGMDLKAETIGLAVALELPLLVINTQRAGSTGCRPTEAADLLMAIHGRHGESPLPVVPPRPRPMLRGGLRVGPDRRPLPHAGDPALRHLPGQLLRAWSLAGAADLHGSIRGFATSQPRREFWPYMRDEGLARPGRCPGTKGLQHVITGSRRRPRPATSATRRRTTRG